MYKYIFYPNIIVIVICFRTDKKAITGKGVNFLCTELKSTFNKGVNFSLYRIKINI